MKKEKIIKILFCFLLSFVVITICSKNSFLYKFNDWVDANAFFTMGKGWMNGLIPYRDLFEQKGPLLYLIYGIGYLFSHTSLIGIYLIEILSFTIFNYFCIKSLEMITSKLYPYLIVIVASTIIGTSMFFVQGGSAEEFCLPLIAICFYNFQKYFANKMIYDKKNLFYTGLCAGIVSLIKFNLLGFWFVWMAFIFFNYIIKKDVKNAFKSCIPFLIGMFIPIVLISIYFIINHAFNDFVECYITFNFGAYTTDLSLIDRIKQCFSNFWYHFSLIKIIMHLILFSFVSFAFSNKIFDNINLKLFTIVSFAFLGIGIYIGGLPYNYYFLLNEYYIIFGLAALTLLVDNRWIGNNKIKYFILCIIALLFAGYQLKKCPNISSRHLEKQYFAQYTFDEIIKEKKNATILNYDNLDGGFYTVSNILPTTKYFMRQNISYERYPKILDEQNRIIKDKNVDFIIIREYFDNIGYHKTIPFLNENYKLIKQQTQYYEGMEFTYFLYQKGGE